MRGELSRHLVSLPDIHLITTGAVVIDIGHTIDPGRLWTLSIAVAGTVGRTGRVQGRATTSSGHLGEVECAVHTARKVTDIHGEGKLLVEELQEVVVFTSRSQKVHTWRDACLSTIDVQILMERHGVAADRDTMLGIVVNALDGTVAGTGLSIGADGLIREARGVLAGSTGLDVVDGVGKGIENDRCLLGHTTMAGGAELSWQLGVDFRSLANLLGSGNRDQARKSEDRGHSCEAVVMLLLLRAVHHSGELPLYLAISPSCLYHISGCRFSAG